MELGGTGDRERLGRQLTASGFPIGPRSHRPRAGEFALGRSVLYNAARGILTTSRAVHAGPSPGVMTSIVRALLSRLLGERGERAAARYLRRHGLRVLYRGYRTRWGEIDLIAREADTLVFVEVKARRRGFPPRRSPPRSSGDSPWPRCILSALPPPRTAEPIRRRGHRLARRPSPSGHRAHPQRLRGRRPRSDVFHRWDSRVH